MKRIADITETLRAIHDGWPFLLVEIDARIQELTVQLVNADNEQTRGRIKALMDLKELPEVLSQEREGLASALSDEDAEPE